MNLAVDQKIKVSFYLFFPGGGIGRYTAELLGALSRRDEFDLELISNPDFRWKEHLKVPLWPGLRGIAHRLPPLRRANFLYGQWVNPIRGIRHALRRGARIIHFAEFNHLTYPAWKALVAPGKVKVAISAHDIYRLKTILPRRWEDRQLREVYRRADALFVHSQFQVDALAAFAGIDNRDKIHIVPHGPYPYGPPPAALLALRRAWGLPEGRPMGLFFGQLRDEKNLDRLLLALASRPSSTHLLVAGKGGGRHRDAAHYQRLAESLGLAPQVTFWDRYIPDVEVPQLFAVSDWVALPYARHFTSQSGVLNIAAHYRRPVLTSDAPVLAETVRRHDIGVVCEGDDPAAIAAGLDRLLDRLRAGHRHDFEAYEVAHSWEENARRTAAVYRQLLEEQ